MPIPHKFSPGLKFLPYDAVVLSTAPPTAWLFFHLGGISFGVIFSLVVFQFFMFCNVFRVQTLRELTWVALALPLAVGWALLITPPVLLIGLWMVGTGALVIWWEMKDPLYHGMFWRKINPNLREIWEEANRATERGNSVSTSSSLK
jgi:hypothetical protein